MHDDSWNDDDNHNDNNPCLTSKKEKLCVALSTPASITVEFVESIGDQNKEFSTASQTLLTGSGLWSIFGYF